MLHEPNNLELLEWVSRGMPGATSWGKLRFRLTVYRLYWKQKYHVELVPLGLLALTLLAWALVLVVK